MTTETQQQQNLEKIIHGIFIEPIRNIAIIDDQFPSYLDLLSLQNSETANTSTISEASAEDDNFFHAEPALGDNSNNTTTIQTVSTLKKLLESCSDRYVVYADNKIDVGMPIIQYSDIFILDYMLTSDKNPSHCINILFKFLKRDKPTLGIIYTQEEISEVAINIACALSGKKNIAYDEESRDIQEDRCRDLLLSHFEVYTKCAKYSDKDKAHIDFLTQLIDKVITDHFPGSACTFDYRPVLHRLSNHFFLTGENFYILIVNKNDTDIDSKEKLQSIITSALKEKCPTPIKMIAHNCISELSANAPSVIQRAFGDAEERAGLLYHAMSQEYPTDHGDHRRYELICHDIVGRIMEDLAQPVSFGIKESVKSVLSHFEARQNGLESYKKLEEASSEDIAVMIKLNAKLCSKSHDSDHVTTGTVFTFDEGFYVCTSPSCDLVPNREDGKTCQRKKLKKANYFFASKLTRIQNETQIKQALEKATQGKHIFVNTPDDSFVFSFCGDNNFPKPFTFYVTNSGFIDINKQFNLEFIVSNGEILSQKRVTAKVLSQLRHLYASNLLQKFGAYNFRIGVDFRSHP